MIGRAIFYIILILFSSRSEISDLLLLTITDNLAVQSFTWTLFTILILLKDTSKMVGTTRLFY